MNELTIADLQVQIEALKVQIAELAARLPAAKPAAAVAEVPVAAAATTPVPPVAVPVPEPEISEETLIAIAAAVAAYLGVRAHIKTVRLIGSGAWAQQGRVFLQASHRLNVQNMRPRSASE